MSDPSILIVVGQVLGEPWLDIATRGQLQTWVPVAESNGFRVRHSFGRPPGPLLKRVDSLHEHSRWTHWGRRIVPRLDLAWGSLLVNWRQKVSVDRFAGQENVGWRQSLPDLYMFQRWKVLGSLEQSLSEDFDFVYFTTASSYIRPLRLAEFVSSLPKSQVYAGTPMVDHDSGIVFCSGANRLMSRDVVELVVANRRRYRNDVMEDVGLGRLLTELSVAVTPAPSVNVGSLEELDVITDEILAANFHFRVKSGPHAARKDVELMRLLDEKLVNTAIGH